MPKASIAGAHAGGTLRFGGMKFVHMGFYGYSFSYMSMPFLYFSLDPAEYAPQNGGEAARIGRDRIIFQYRPSIWAALTEYMPRDMVKRLDDVIRNERGGHFRRRPGA